MGTTTEIMNKEFEGIVESMGFEPNEIRSVTIYIGRGLIPMIRVEKLMDVPSLQRAIKFTEDYQLVRRVLS